MSLKLYKANVKFYPRPHLFHLSIRANLIVFLTQRERIL